MSKFRSLKRLQSFVCILHLHQLVQVAPGVHEVAADPMGCAWGSQQDTEPKLVMWLHSCNLLFPSQAENS